MEEFLLPYSIMTFDGRGDGTRTHGLCVPNAALYQTEPHLDIIFNQNMKYYTTKKCACKDFFQKKSNIQTQVIGQPVQSIDLTDKL